jgi:sulfite exporter TauE/SafE/copper chaperone CopZ
MENNKKKIYIEGMTCVSCEVLISNELKEIEGVENVTVCHRKKIAEIEYTGNTPPLNKIIYKIKNIGYEASENPTKPKKEPKATAMQWFYSLLIVFAFYLVYKYFEWIGLMDWIQVDSTNINFGVAFLIGIVASMSTCLAVVGAVVISFAAKYENNTGGSFYQRNLKQHLMFHAGRLATFFLLGGVLGIVGSWFDVSGSFMGYFTIAIAIILGWLGLNILGITPSLTSVGIHMPKKAMNVWEKLKNSEHALAPVILGGFTFFLPCGFTQSMQLFAVTSGDFWTGAFTLFSFALGTTPILIGLGVATTKARNKRSVVLKKVIGIVVMIFAFYTLTTGFTLAGINIGFTGKKEVGNTVNQENVQVVEMTVGYYGFSPNVFNVKQGIPVKWIIKGENVTGCTNEIIMPSANIKKKIQPGENIIEFTPTGTGTINFSCWMGMTRGKFIVK